MNASSPVKRRVLGALDPNACSPSKAARRHEGGKLFSRSPTKVVKPVMPRPAFAEVTSPARGARVPVPVPVPSVSLSGTPDKETEMEMWVESRKRRSPTPTLTPAAQDNEPAAKRACLESAREDMQGRRLESPPSSSWTTRTSGTTRHRSPSPDTPSVFDNSAADNSQVTILTEPDTTGPAPVPAVAPLSAPRARPRLTREQAREKAEIIRLRLGLASYKVRTGQTDVPLDRLEAQHARSSVSLPSQSPSPSPSPSQTQGRSQTDTQSQTQGRNRSSTSVSASFPPPANTSFTSTTATTPGRGGSSSRRPLPGAPLRRASSSASVSFDQQHQDVPREAPPSRAVLLEEAQLAIARDERRQQQHQQQHHHQQQQPRHNHSNQHHQHQLPPREPQLPRPSNNNNNNNYHQRRQSEALHTHHNARRHMYGSAEEYAAVPPRPRTAVGSTSTSTSTLTSSSFSSSFGRFGRRVSFVDGVDERGGGRDRDNGRDGGHEDYEDLERRRGGAASGLLSLARS